MVESEINSGNAAVSGATQFESDLTAPLNCTDSGGAEHAAVQFWRVDPTKLNYGEWARFYTGPTPLIGWIARLFGARPSIDPRAPFVPDFQRLQVAPVALSDRERARLTPEIEKACALGFHSPIFVQLENPYIAVTTTSVALVHPAGHTIANIVFSRPQPSRAAQESLASRFLSQTGTATFLVTSRKRDVEPVDGIRHIQKANATPEQLWQVHQDEMAKVEGGAGISQVRRGEEIWRLLNAYEAFVHEARVRRGLYISHRIDLVEA